MSARIQVVLFGPEGRGSFNEAGHAGAVRARDAGHDVAVAWIADPDPEARAAAVLALCESEPDLVVAHGGQGDYPVAVAAARHPLRRFVVTQGSVLGANTASYTVLQEQSAFLAGVLAATDSRTGVVAHLSGEKVRPGLKGRAAFLHGVRSAMPGATALTTFCGNQHDPELAGRAVTAQARAGADIVFAMIDGGRDGAIAACRACGIRQIGNVLDWTRRHPEVFLASAVADSGLCVEHAIADFARDRVAWGTARAFGLETPAAVRLALRRDVSQAARVALDHWSQRLLDGGVAVDEDYAGPEFETGGIPAVA
ncbi:BMP family ABC transporter substrate-binding protein [Cupriavidus sp. SS-3]|uniref:BMP family ABC transporter substrate-binding protein n=1 Tax=Cupriavidus sp. SS-3 TaxID=3109596 RepID=UPI002DBB5DD0|nr:BMP family ABC transporter substrate-binding protein [Cupriavidus sp. SS-3]MEC3765954.1 BMP family ABC transporter substrate-binding protein [Cupriavidus sp. SS-3]